jgi:hypothetical protein
MDRRVYQWAGIALVVLVILTKTPLVFSLFALLILGVIPGTTLVIPAWISLLVYPLLIVVTLLWLSTWPRPLPASTVPVRAAQKPSRSKKIVSKSIKQKSPATKRRARAAV